jgi:hypothetical protein
MTIEAWWLKKLSAIIHQKIKKLVLVHCGLFGTCNKGGRSICKMSHLLLLSMDFTTYMYIYSLRYFLVCTEKEMGFCQKWVFCLQNKIGMQSLQQQNHSLKEKKKNRGKYNNVCEAYVWSFKKIWIYKLQPTKCVLY